jgi:ABC-2 type transport system ATP-binding protein
MRLVIEGVGKQYRGNVWGLRGFSLELGPGVLGLVGPNGAGKSTLMGILATVTRPTEGKVTWDGVDITRSPNEVREVLGYLPQDFGIYPHLNAVEFLEYLAAVKGLGRSVARRRIRDLLEFFHLTDVCRRPLGTYSGGMKQRVGIAQALLNNPRLLIVDEPTSGLDPGERVEFRNLLTSVAGERIAILSTHIISDVEAAANSIAIIKQGRLLGRGSPEALLAAVEGQVWEWVVPSANLDEVRQEFPVSSAIRRGDGVHVRVIASAPPDGSSEAVPPTLEDAYLYAVSTVRPGEAAA